jgi:ketosteroid isomerase-like protein
LSDPIAPPAARWPSEAAELVSLAVSDGDLGAAVAQYEQGAVLWPWADDRAGGTIHESMTKIMCLRLPLDTRLLAVLPADGLTMLVCERRIEGADPDGKPVRLWGVGCTVVRARADGIWRIAADAWRLTDTSDSSPLTPVASPSARGHIDDQA